jgi:hypothetical protein
MDHIVRNAGFSRPLCNRQCLTVGRQPSVTSTIILVVYLRYPAAVVRRVSLGSVSPVDLQPLAVAVGLRPCEEASSVGERFFAHRDSARAIETVSCTLRVVAAGLRRRFSRVSCSRSHVAFSACWPRSGDVCLHQINERYVLRAWCGAQRGCEGFRRITAREASA